MKMIDYVLGNATVANPDGSMPATIINCTPTSGPGNLPAGNFPNAIDLGIDGHLQVSLNAAQITSARFCISIIFKVDNPVTARQNLIESTCLPFSMFIDKVGGSNDFKVCASVAPKNYGWSGTTTEFFKDLKLGTWYKADLVYDTDTVAVFIDEKIVSVHAFPIGLIEKSNGNQLFIGTWVDGARNHLNGKIAAVQWYNDEIPAELEKQLDERRGQAEWFLTYKQEAIKNTLNFGNQKGRYTYDSSASAYIQLFDNGLLMYNDGIGAAFEMHGSIFQYYQTKASKAELGYLVSDEGNTTKAGGRKSLFSKGGIYFSSATGAVAVSGQLYIDYESYGESSFIGWPVSAAANISNGKEQIFQGARMYFKNGTSKAFEVHGDILARLLAIGGIGTWGFPVSNESDIRNGATLLGRYNDFENCTIYWSGATGAFEVHGDIRQKYKDRNGPIGQFGFPTSNEATIPGTASARYNTFQNGSILWFGGWGNMYTCMAFKIYLGRIDTKEEEGWTMGENDLYFRATIDNNGASIFNQRYPNSGDYGGHNVRDINVTLGNAIVPNRADMNLKLTLDIWDSDPGNDDHLGVYTKVLNMANAWGLAENNGIYNSGSFSKINSITWSIQPQVNEKLLSQGEKWWGVTNTGTPTLSYGQYASAFRDVDNSPEWWDLTDWLEKAFYELVVKGLASKGNCFGMSLEAINAYKHKSLFSLPLNRFNNWNAVVNEFNIKHQYQVGAAGVWWFVGQFLSGNTHDPVSVFNETRNEFNRGNNPVVCIAQNFDFSGAAHCILPVGWDSSTKPWRLDIYDPNFPSAVRALFVDPDKNEFTYNGKSSYHGGASSGGRFHYMPYSMLNERPRTPIWDAIALLLAGTVIIFGADTDTQSLVDSNGIDLDAYGQDSINKLKQGKSLDNKFVSVKGFDANLLNLYMRTEKPGLQSGTFTPGIKDYAANLNLGDLIADPSFAASLSAISANRVLFNSLKDRNITSLINDKLLTATLNPAILTALNSVVAVNAGKNFKHQLSGNKNGQLNYGIKHQLNEFRLQSTINLREQNTIESNNLGTSSAVVKMSTNQNKTVRLEVTNRLGVGKDNIKITVDKIPVAVGKDMSFNMKPGLAGLDILTTAERVNAVVSVQGNISGKAYSSNYNVALEGGLRIRPSTVLTQNELKIGKIDSLFGQFRDPLMLKSM